MYAFLCKQNQEENMGSVPKFLGAPLPLGLESADPTSKNCRGLVLHLGLNMRNNDDIWHTHQWIMIKTYMNKYIILYYDILGNISTQILYQHK